MSSQSRESCEGKGLLEERGANKQEPGENQEKAENMCPSY